MLIVLPLPDKPLLQFCAAVDKKDFKGMAKAFKAAFEMLESMPHDEAPHEEQE